VLCAGRGKYNVLRNLWVEVLLVGCRWRRRFHWAHYMPCSESFLQRLLYRLYIPFHILLPRWTGYLQESLLEKTAQSISPYWYTGKGYSNRLFVTRSGYVGLCPSTARPGDAVYILHVLRKRDNGRSGYTLIGDAFVYGAMDGELVNSDMKQVDVEMF
jgi:hypothetical protein